MAISPVFWRIDEFVKAANGPALAGAEVFFVVQPSNTTSYPPSPLVQLYADPFGITPITQPLIADGFGHVSAYVVAGTYTEVVAINNINQLVYPDQSYGISSAQVLFETNGIPNSNQGLLNLVGSGDTSVFTNALGQTVIESTGVILPGTGTGPLLVTAFAGFSAAPNGDVITADGLGNAIDSGVPVSSLAPLLNPVFTNQITVDGYTDMLGNASVGGNLSVTGSVFTTGNTSIGGTLGVTGQTTVVAINATGYADLEANANVGGNLSVGGGIIGAGYLTVATTLGVTGLSTLTSLIANSLNTNIVIADQFAGADLGAQISAAFTQLGSTPGEVWVIKPIHNVITTAVIVGAFQTLRFYPGVYTINYSGGGVVFTLGNYACIIGMGTAGNSVNMGLNGAADCSSVVTNSANTNQAMTVSGLYIDSGTDSPTVTIATLYFNALGQLSKCEDCIIIPPNSTTAPAILFNECGDVLCRHNWVNGTGASIGVGGIKYTTAVNGQGAFFEDNITEHLAASTSVLQTYGLLITTTGGALLKNVHVYGHHCEQDVADTGSGVFAGVYILGSGCQGGTIINASLTQNAGSYGIVVRLNACTNYTVLDTNGYSALIGIDDNSNSTTLSIPVPFYTQAVLATGGTIGLGNGSATNMQAAAHGTGSGPTTVGTAAGWMEITVAGTTKWLPYFA